MTTRLGILAIAAWLAGVAPAGAWAPTAHQRFAQVLASDPIIAQLMRARGLSEAQLRYYAVEADANMPAAWKNGDWDGVATYAAFKATWLDGRPVNHRNAGYLLHILADVSVPVCHAPASRTLPGASAPFCDNVFENTLEPFGELQQARMALGAPARQALGPACPQTLPLFDALATEHLAHMKTPGGLVDRARNYYAAARSYAVCTGCRALGRLAQALSAQCRACGPGAAVQPTGLAELVLQCWSSSLKLARFAFELYLTYGK